MITRRELVIALIAAAFAAASTAVVCAHAGQMPVLSSSVFDWKAMTATPTDTGSMRAVIKQPTATLEQLEVHITTLDPGKAPHPPHRHPNEELIIVRQGTVEAQTNGEWKRVGPGSVIFFASNQLHGLRNVGAEAAVYDVVNFKTAATPAATAE